MSSAPKYDDNGNSKYKNGYCGNKWWGSHSDGNGKQKRFYLLLSDECERAFKNYKFVKIIFEKKN